MDPRRSPATVRWRPSEKDSGTAVAVSRRFGGCRIESRHESAGPATQEELVHFFSVLAHDLKSPIFAVDGFSDLLLSDYHDKLDEEGQDFLSRIRSS